MKLHKIFKSDCNHLTRFPSSHFRDGSNSIANTLNFSFRTAFPFISNCVKRNALKSDVTSQWSRTSVFSFSYPTLSCFASKVCDNGDEQRYLVVSIAWAPIMLKETSSTLKELSSFRGSRAVKLLIWLLLRFKQARSCNASKPVKKRATSEGRRNQVVATCSSKIDVPNVPTVWLTIVAMSSGAWSHRRIQTSGNKERNHRAVYQVKN